jgi:hypothetical protein
MSETVPPSVINQTLEMVPIDTVQTHPRNARRGDVDAIAQSILVSILSRPEGRLQR